jgi:hypothetical protein
MDLDDVEQQLQAAELFEMEQQLSDRLSKLSRLNQLEAFEHVHAQRSSGSASTAAATRAYLRSVRKSVGEIEHMLRGRMPLDLDLDADRSEPIGKVAERMQANHFKPLHSSSKSRSIEGLIQRAPNVRSTICSTRQPIDFVEATESLLSPEQQSPSVQPDRQLSPPPAFQDSQDQAIGQSSTLIGQTLNDVYDLALGDALEGALEQVEHVIRSVTEQPSVENKSSLDLTGSGAPTTPMPANSGSSVYLSAISSSRESYWTAKASLESPLTIATGGDTAEDSLDKLHELQEYRDLSPVDVRFERKSTQSTIEETPDRSDALTVVEVEQGGKDEEESTWITQNVSSPVGDSIHVSIQEAIVCPETAECVFVDESIEDQHLPIDSKEADHKGDLEAESEDEQCRTFSLSESNRYVPQQPPVCASRAMKFCLEAVACQQLAEAVPQTDVLEEEDVQDDDEDETEKQSDEDVLDEGEPVGSDELDVFADRLDKDETTDPELNGLELNDPELNDPTLIHVGGGVYLRRGASSELSTVSEVSEEFSNLPASVGSSSASAAPMELHDDKVSSSTAATSTGLTSDSSSNRNSSSAKGITFGSEDSDFVRLQPTESSSNTSLTSTSDSTSAGGPDLSSVNLDENLNSFEMKSSDNTASACESSNLKSKSEATSSSSNSSSGASAMAKLLEVAAATAEQTVAAALATLNAQATANDLSFEEVASSGSQTTGSTSYGESNTNRTTANIAIIEPSTSLALNSNQPSEIANERKFIGDIQFPTVSDGLSSARTISNASEPSVDPKEPVQLDRLLTAQTSCSWPITNATPTANLLRSTQSDAMVQELMNCFTSPETQEPLQAHSNKFSAMQPSNDTGDRSSDDSTSGCRSPKAFPSLRPGESFGEPALDSPPLEADDSEVDRVNIHADLPAERVPLDPMPLDLLDLNNNHSERLDLNNRLEADIQALEVENLLGPLEEVVRNGSAQAIAIATAEPLPVERPIDTGESSQATERDVAQFSLEQQNSQDLIDDDSLSLCFTQSMSAQPFSFEQLESYELPPTPSLPLPIPYEHDHQPPPATLSKSNAVQSRKAIFERQMSGPASVGPSLPAASRTSGLTSSPASIAPPYEQVGETEPSTSAVVESSDQRKRSSRVKALRQQFESGTSSGPAAMIRLPSSAQSARSWQRSDSEPVRQDGRLAAIALNAEVAAASAPQSLERKLSEQHGAVRKSFVMKKSQSVHASVSPRSTDDATDDMSLQGTLESLRTNEALPSSSSIVDGIIKQLPTSLSEPIDIGQASLTESHEASDTPLAVGLSSSEQMTHSSDAPMMAYEPMLSSAADLSSSMDRVESDVSALQTSTTQTSGTAHGPEASWSADKDDGHEPETTEEAISRDVSSRDASESHEQCSCSSVHLESTDLSVSRRTAETEQSRSADRPEVESQLAITKRKLVAQSTLPGYSLASPALRPLTATRSVGRTFTDDLSKCTVIFCAFI